MKAIFMLRVAESRVLTGLGVLLLPAGPPETLASMPLHTSLAVRMVFPDKQEFSATASVEEVSRAGEPTVRVLLLTQQDAAVVPVGTEMWLGEQEE